MLVENLQQRHTAYDEEECEGIGAGDANLLTP